MEIGGSSSLGEWVFRLQSVTAPTYVIHQNQIAMEATAIKAIIKIGIRVTSLTILFVSFLDCIKIVTYGIQKIAEKTVNRAAVCKPSPEPVLM